MARLIDLTLTLRHGMRGVEFEQAKTVESEVGILTPTETAELLNACEPELVPAVAIGAFGGGSNGNRHST